jgi:hypothetical protein
MTANIANLKWELHRDFNDKSSYLSQFDWGRSFFMLNIDRYTVAIIKNSRTPSTLFSYTGALNLAHKETKGLFFGKILGMRLL